MKVYDIRLEDKDEENNKIQKEKNWQKFIVMDVGKKITIKNEMIQEGMFHGEILWGYFSNKDTEHHEFDLCEACYDRITADFVIPLTVKKEKELL